MTMVSMKQEPKKDGETGEVCCAGEQSLYPYGLCINLNDESMKKLGLSFDKLSIGQKLNLSAVLEVTSVSAYKEQDGTEASASLQITDMELAPAQAKTPGQSLYTNSDMKP